MYVCYLKKNIYLSAFKQFFIFIKNVYFSILNNCLRLTIVIGKVEVCCLIRYFIISDIIIQLNILYKELFYLLQNVGKFFEIFCLQNCWDKQHLTAPRLYQVSAQFRSFTQLSRRFQNCETRRDNVTKESKLF